MFIKDDLIRLAPGTHLNLKPCQYYQNIFASEPRISLTDLFCDRKGWYWRMAGDHLFCQSSEDQIRGDRFKFPKEEAGLALREPSPLEHSAKARLPTHENKVSDEPEGPFWPSKSVDLSGDYSHFLIFPGLAHSL